MNDIVDRYSQLLEIARDELNVHEFQIAMGRDENNNEIFLVWNGTYLHWLHGGVAKPIKDTDGVARILEAFFLKEV